MTLVSITLHSRLARWFMAGSVGVFGLKMLEICLVREKRELERMNFSELVLEIVFLTFHPNKYCPIWKAKDVPNRGWTFLKDALFIFSHFLLVSFFSIFLTSLQLAPQTQKSSANIFLRQALIIGNAVGLFWSFVSGMGEINNLMKRLLFAEMSCMPSIDKPWCSRSVKELWSKRWAHLLSLLYKKTLFFPLSKILGSHISACVVFLFSGLLHEWQMFAATGIFCGSEILFFCFHLLATLLQTLVSPTYNSCTRNLSLEGTTFLQFIEICFTLFFSVFTLLIFLQPFFQHHFFQEIYLQVPLKSVFQPPLTKFVDFVL